MRVFTDKEKDFLNLLLDIKRKGEYRNLHFSNFLPTVLDSLAIRIYNTDKCKFIDLFSKVEYKPTDKLGWLSIINKFNIILDFVYFIEELEKYNLIRLQVNSWEDTPEMATSLLYNRNFYEYNVDGFFDIETKEILKMINNQNLENIYCYTDLLDKYVDKVIYPTSLLEDLANNEFQSIEERRFKKQQRWTIFSVVIAAIAVIAPIVYNVFLDDSPNHSDMKNIEFAILQNKIVTIDSVAKHHIDTINVNITNKQQIKPIDLKVTVKPNQVTR